MNELAMIYTAVQVTGEYHQNNVLLDKGSLITLPVISGYDLSGLLLREEEGGKKRRMERRISLVLALPLLLHIKMKRAKKYGSMTTDRIMSLFKPTSILKYPPPLKIMKICTFLKIS